MLKFLTGLTEAPLLTDHLYPQIGYEGSSQAVVTVDLGSHDLRLGNLTDPFGFKYGWRGSELQRPQIKSTFRPRFITLNTVEGAGLERVSDDVSCYTKTRTTSYVHRGIPGTPRWAVNLLIVVSVLVSLPFICFCKCKGKSVFDRLRVIATDY